jgi:putative membrane protein insertion efficiency factor
MSPTASPSPAEPPRATGHLVARLAALPLRFYRRFLSPLKPPTCRFQPTCSQYAIEALERHGTARGTLLALWRLLRCQPFARAGHDPVPPVRGAAAHGSRSEKTA